MSQEYVVVDTRQSDLRLYYNRVPTLRSSRDGIYYVRNGLLRELTGYEALLLQGFPVDYANRAKHVVLNRDLLRQAGNAMTVTVIHAIGNSLLSYVKDISKVDENIIERKSMINTIVGVVKSREQYNHCFENMCYYTYANKINACIKDIEYISIYQPKTSFGEDNAGVYVYGKVTKVSEIYRDEISFGVNNANRKKKCILFEIKSWKKLKLPILPSGNAKIILETTFDKLLNANIYMDLT